MTNHNLRRMAIHSIAALAIFFSTPLLALPPDGSQCAGYGWTRDHWIDVVEDTSVTAQSWIGGFNPCSFSTSIAFRSPDGRADDDAMGFNAGQAEASVTFSMSFDYGDYVSAAEFGVEDDTQLPWRYYYPNTTSQTKNVCPVPAGEVSTAVSFLSSQDDTGGIFNVQLRDRNSAGQLVVPPDPKYRGRHVDESFAGVYDGCWWSIPNPGYPRIEAVQSGPGWNIAASGSWYGGSDAITNPTSWVNYWQTRIRSESLPSCTESEMQSLRISGCGQYGLPMFYQSHGTGVTVAADKITAVRDNASISSPN